MVLVMVWVMVLMRTMAQSWSHIFRLLSFFNMVVLMRVGGHDGHVASDFSFSSSP